MTRSSYIYILTSYGYTIAAFTVKYEALDYCESNNYSDDTHGFFRLVNGAGGRRVKMSIATGRDVL